MGEIYVKHSPLGNNDLEKFLASQGCEVNIPGLMGMIQYSTYNLSETARLYGGTVLEKMGSGVGLKYIEQMESAMIRALKENGFHAPLPFRELTKLADGIIGRGNKMGEGWLLTPRWWSWSGLAMRILSARSLSDVCPIISAERA